MALNRTEIASVVSIIDGRAPQHLDAFIADCGLPASDHARRIADAIRKSLAHRARFSGDKLRADDAYPGALEVLPGWDSLDFMEWVMTLEEYLGEPFPNGTFDSIRGSFTAADLMKAAVNAPTSSVGQDRKAR